MNKILGQFKKFSKIQVGALMECTDLELNGYTKIFSVFEKEFWLIKLRHRRNGNTIIVKWKPEQYSLWRNGIEIKSVGDLL